MMTRDMYHVSSVSYAHDQKRRNFDHNFGSCSDHGQSMLFARHGMRDKFGCCKCRPCCKVEFCQTGSMHSCWDKVTESVGRYPHIAVVVVDQQLVRIDRQQTAGWMPHHTRGTRSSSCFRICPSHYSLAPTHVYHSSSQMSSADQCWQVTRSDTRSKPCDITTPGSAQSLLTRSQPATTFAQRR